MAPRISPEQADDRRAQIRAAAQRCFVKKGFHRTSMRDICAEAGLSVGAVYSYFNSKEDIIADAAVDERAFIREVFERNSANPDPAQCDIVRTFFTMAADPDTPPMALSLWGEAATNERVRTILADLRTELIDRLEERVAEAQKTGEISPELDSRSVAQVMLAMHNGMVVQMGICGDVDLDAYIQVVEATCFGPPGGGNGGTTP
ncbi:MAG: TetR/AcrR family transcriptional regulator [Nitrospirota bacterium]|nr:TetR/AcrR family transcriptional regulator [Nitrospirota bacterium]